jgi:hypothetical protein
MITKPMEDVMNFTTKAQQKAELKKLNYLAEKKCDELRDALLIFKKDTIDPVKIEELTELYYNVPSYLSGWTNNKRKMFKHFPAFISAMDELKDRYNEVKEATISPAPKVNTVKDIAKNEIKSMLESGKKVEDHDMSKFFADMKVTVNAHYVYRDGTSFLRCFWYLNGNVTAYDKIVAIATERMLNQQR